MRRLKRIVIVLAASALIISLAMILPAGAQTTSRDVEYMDYELVLCDTDADGDIEKIQLLNWIALNGDGTVDVEAEKAFEETTSWQGVHGWTTPTDEGDLLLWEGLSTSDFANFPAMTQFSESMVEDSAMRIPLELRYQYWLDGKPVDPANVTGQSGRFRMELTLTNNSEEMTVVEYEDPETGEMMKTEIETYLPMVIIPYDWYFDNTTFFNLECDPTGLVFWMPDFYQVGWSIPLFPPATEKSHTIWVEADVKNFHMPTLTLPVAFVFPETNQIDTTAVFKNGLEQLFDGVKQLDEGLVAAEEGVGDPGTSDTLLFGISAVNGGLNELLAGQYELQAGANAMIPGVQDALAGIGSEATADTLLYAVASTQAGLNALLVGLNDAIAGIGSPTTDPSLLFGLAQITAGLNQTLGGLQQMSAGLGARGTANTIIWGLDQISQNTNPTNPAGLYQGLLQIAAALSPGSGLTTLYDFTLNVAKPITDGVDPTIWLNQQAMMNGYAGGLNTMAAGVQSAYDALEVTAGGIIPNLEGMKVGMDDMIAGISNLMLPGVAEIEAGLQQILAGLNGAVAGIGGSTVPNTLLWAMAQIQYGLNEMKAGLSSGDPNNPGLLEGLVLISGGLGQAIQGIGSSGTPDTLLYGGTAVESGLVEMGAGLQEGTGGTAQMLESLMDTLVMLNVTEAELEAIHMRGEEFDHFLGRAEGAEDNQVRFVYQTKPAYDYVDGNSWITALILSIIIGLLLLIGGIVLIRVFA
jgi:putative membrane protein